MENERSVFFRKRVWRRPRRRSCSSEVRESHVIVTAEAED